MSRTARIGAAIIAAALALATASPVKGMWAYWGQWTPVVRFEQRYTIDAAGEYTFWATQFNFVEAAHSGGYVGVQTGGWAMEHGETDLAIFSLWDAISVSPSPGASCGTFGGEGEGLSCRIPITVETGHRYGVGVERVAAGDKRRPWSTFAAWVVNYTTGERFDLGTITVPFFDAMTQPNNFIEYFGPTRTCDTRPFASATFQAPVVVPLETKKPVRLPQSGSSTPACSREVANPSRGSIKISTGTNLAVVQPPTDNP